VFSEDQPVAGNPSSLGKKRRSTRVGSRLDAAAREAFQDTRLALAGGGVVLLVVNVARRLILFVVNLALLGAG